MPEDATKPPGRRARKAMAVRTALFAAGVKAFERQPIGLVSILDITEAADVAKGVFYLHFRSKDEYLLALWQDVQRTFLDRVRSAAGGCRSRSARIETAVRLFAEFATENSPAARFWIRMSGYFSDEIGEPGRLMRIHREYVEQLAAVFAGGAIVQLGPEDVRSALMADSICRAVTTTSAMTGEPLCDTDALVRMVAFAIKTAQRD